MKYQVVHKLTGKPVRDFKTAQVIIFDSEIEALKLVEAKNRVNQSGFYKVEVVK